MVLGERGEKRLGENGKGLKFVAPDGQGKNGEIDRGGTEAFEQDRGNFLDDRNLGLGKLSGKSNEMGRQKVRSNRGNNADGDGASDGILLVGEVPAGGFDFAQNGASAGQEGLSHLREADGTAEAIKETTAEFVFQFADLLGKRRLRDVGEPSGAAETAGIDDGAEIAELVKFHGIVIRYRS